MFTANQRIASVSIQKEMEDEIIHTLAVGPLTYSRVSKNIPERLSEHEDFDKILNTVADLRKPILQSVLIYC
jgi:E3 ubiquitin-protein ligase UBR1